MAGARPRRRKPRTRTMTISLTAYAFAVPSSFPRTKLKDSVMKKLKGLSVLETKYTLIDKYNVRAMSSMKEVVSDAPLSILRRNFSAQERRLVTFAARSPIALTSLSGFDAQELCGIN